MKKVRILSLDGGGIRGILPGIVLTQIEKKLQDKTGDSDLRIADMFDFISGTSTGGILALAYLTPDEDGRPKLTAQEAVDLYLDRGDDIFDVSFWQKVKSGAGILDEKYDASVLEKELKKTFGDVELKDLLKPCVVTSYDMANGKPHLFKQHRCEDPTYNFKVREVARATSAAPTYFEMANVTNSADCSFPVVDGAVVANNPALVAYSEVRTMNFEGMAERPTAKDMMIVSIGTGGRSKKYNYEDAKDWGAVAWIKPVIEVMMSGSAKTVHYHLTQIFDTLEEKDKSDYHRLEPEVINADYEMDNASPENLIKLKEDGLNFVNKPEVQAELDQIVEKLLAYSDVELQVV